VKEARYLLSHILGIPLSATYLNPSLTVEQQEAYQTLLDRRLKGEPLAYLIQSTEFWSLNLKITRDVLIPRPETELLVEQALHLIEPRRLPMNILELGTGSGAIAIALKKERPDWQVVAVDKSPAALAIAKENANTHQADILFFESDWFSEVPHRTSEKFDLIVSNPPYIAEQDPHFQGSIRYEPRIALASGLDGLKDLTNIVSKSREYLKPNGLLLLEHGYDQAEAVRSLLKRHHYQNIATVQDLFGNDRVTHGIWNEGSLQAISIK
jgi:release factor glutamine methyltransferase